MRNFARALREAWRHWPALAAAVGCSLGAAVLWSLNIAALFPIIQTTLNGQTLQEWNRGRTAAAQAAAAACDEQIVRWQQERDAAADDDQRRQLNFRVEVAEAEAAARRAAAFSSQRLQGLFDRYLPAKPFTTVTLIVGLVAALTLVKQLLAVSNVQLVSHVSQSIVRDVRNQIFAKALSLDRPTFARQGVSGFAAQITHTTDMLSQGVTSFYGGAVSEPLRILFCLVGALVISWRLTLASLIFAPLAAFVMLHLNRKIRGLSVRILDRSLGYHHVMLEVFQGLQTVQAYGMEPFEQRRFQAATQQMKRTAQKAAFYHSLANPLTEFVGMGMLCVGLIVSSYLVIHQETRIFGLPMTDAPLSAAAVTVFFGMLIGAADPLRKLSGVITGINTGMAAANILYPLLDQESQVQEPAAPTPLPRPHRAVELRNVTFSYDGQHQVLQNVSLTIPHGERLAIVGPNGGGKSTLVNLLCRFYDPQQGAILFDGVNIRDCRLAELRDRIALVTQQTELFNETILHNIRYGRWEASEEEVYAAARLARADEFVRSFPEGYQTLVGPNGQRLSGGQRQRIALARAFLRNADLLILDEATSQIDRQSEQLIHDALEEFGRGRTLIMITHRESTLSLATKIVEVKEGRTTPVALPQTAAA